MCIAHRTINILRSSNNLHESFRAIITLEHAKLYIITLERLNGQSLNISQTGFSTLRRGCAYGSDVLMYWIMVAGTALGLRNAACIVIYCREMRHRLWLQYGRRIYLACRPVADKAGLEAI